MSNCMYKGAIRGAIKKTFRYLFLLHKLNPLGRNNIKLCATHVSVIIFFCLTACTTKNPAKLWFYTHSLNNTSLDHTDLTPTSFININEDSSYTLDFGSFEYGKWVMKDDEMILTNANKITTKFPIKYLGGKDMQLITGEGTVANFEAQPSYFKTPNDDPFSLTNNQWRIHAIHKESEHEIIDRLKNHCKFWVAYFKWADENQFEVVDVRSTPTPVKIYGNGFALKPFEELPREWRSYFFDSEDCKVANNIIYEAFQYHEISWAHTDSKYKMFVGAFQQLQQYL